MDPKKYEKELRIGLVLYGGVSLAIYIYGVAYEFLRLARGEGSYAKLTEKAKVKPVIDIISGSSAGGINGLFLAKALTTGGDLSPLKELWIQKGDLETLVNASSKKPLSLLDSDYYQQQLQEALERVKPDPAASESKRSIELLDLFITATNLDGIVTEYGQPFFHSPIQTKHYNTVFHFKTRPGRYDLSKLLQQDKQKPLPENISTILKDLLQILKQERQGLNDFDPNSDQVAEKTDRDKNYYLARVAAATSSFPVAFAPVLFTNEDLAAMKSLFGSGVTKRDSLLEVRQTQIDQAVVYGDGGMVNNKPFNYTIRTIFHRQADVPVDRKLFFIEPDPVAFNESNRLANQATVDGLHSLMGFFGATFYQSISADLEALVEQNQRIQSVRKILTDFEATLATYLSQHQKSRAADRESGEDRRLYEMQPVYQTYRQIKIASLRQEIEERLLAKADIAQLIEEAAENSPELFAAKTLAERELYMQEQLKQTFAAILAETHHTLITEEDTGQFLRRFDYPFRIRRLRYFVGKLNDWLAEIDLLPDAELYPEQVTSLREHISALKGKIYVFIEFYDHGSWLVWDQAPPITRLADMRQTFDYVCQGYDKLMDGSYKILAFAMISDDLVQTIKQLEQIRPQPPYQIQDNSYYDIREKTAYLENMLNVCSEQDMTACMEQVFNSYEFLDMYLYPATLLANIGEADPIEVIRVSPKDATRYKATVEDKLAGEKLMHFSAFLKRSWRENDLLWGRLDAAEIIARTILPNKEEADKILDELSPAIIKEELTSIRQRREIEISQTLFTDQEQQQIKGILEEQTTLKQAQEVETYLKEHYTTGQEGFESIAQSYLLRTLAKSLRATSKLFEQRSEQDKRAGTSSPLRKPVQYLSVMLNVPYIFLITLGGAEEPQRKRLLNYAMIVAVILFALQLIGAIEARSWLLLGAIAFILLYLQPKRLIWLAILVIALLALLLAIGAIEITSPWLQNSAGLMMLWF